MKWPWSREVREIPSETPDTEERAWFPSWGMLDPNRIPRNSDNWDDNWQLVSDFAAMQMLTVNACIRLLSDTVAGLPIDAYRKNGNVRVAVDPIPSLIQSPFHDLTYFEGMWQIVACMAVKGESLSVVMSRDSYEFATSLTPIHPDDWTVEWDRNDPLRPQPVYKIHNERIPNYDVVHIRRFSLPGNLHGLSPIQAARQGIGLSLNAERYGARYFQDSASPSSVLETDQRLTADQAMQNQKIWVESHGGRRQPAVLSGGLKWKPISITPNESQFLETRQFQRDEIAMLYGIPPHMLGITDRTTSWGRGIEQQSISFVTYTLINWLNPIEEVFSKLLPRGQYARLNVNALLRGDMKSRFDAYVSARNAGWLNVNEIRELEDREPVPDGDQYIQPLNMGPLGSDPLDKPAPSQPGPEIDPTGGTGHGQ
jgi:HK97 family phage portal protein